MANIWDHPETIAAEALRHLEDNLIIAPLCARDVTSDFSNKSNGWKRGDTISFRTHGEFEVNEFTSQIAPQSISTSTRPMTIEKHFDVSVEVTAREEVMDLDSFSDQVLRPATYKMAEKVDTFLGTKILQGAGLYVSAALMDTAADVAQARKYSTIQQLVMNRFCLVDLDTEANLLGQTWFNQAQTRGSDGENALRTGRMNHMMGMDWFSSIAFPSTTFTAGTMVCVTNNGAGGNTNNRIGDSTLIVDTQTAAKELKAGDRIAIAGVRRPLIVKTAIPDTSATTDVVLVDPITEVIPDNAAVTVVGSGKTFTFHGSIFDDKALAVAFPMLDLPGDRVTAVASNNGISIRIVKGYDLTYKKTTLSMDMLCGSFALDPRRMTLLAKSTT